MNDVDEFRKLLAGSPHVLSDDVRHLVYQLTEIPGYGGVMRQLLKLLQEAPSDIDGAYARYEAAHLEATEGQSALEAELAVIDAAMNEDRFDEVISRVDAALPIADGYGLGVMTATLYERRGLALFRKSDADREDVLEESIADLDRALSLVVDGDQRASVLMNLGLAHGERVRGDQSENRELAADLLAGALNQLDDTSPPELRAIVQTNLARAFMRRERGDRSENLHTAVALCEAALEYRSPEVNAYDWAHTMGNLGEALDALVWRDEVPFEAAQQPALAIIAERHRIQADWLVGMAHYSLARLDLRAAAAAPELAIDADPADRRAILDTEPLFESARTHLDAAWPLLEYAPDRAYQGRALSELAYVLAELGDLEEAVEAGRKALQHVGPKNDPQTCSDAAATVGHALAQKGRWHEAAESYRTAITASELLFERRLDDSGRESEIRRAGNQGRWAAFALARDDALVEAAAVLESTRTRELRRRLGVDRLASESLERLPAPLATELLEAGRALAASPMDESGAQAGRRFQELLSEVRSTPGHERFAMGVSAEQLAAGAESGWPFVFVNPTPLGTVLIWISIEGGRSAVDASFIDDLTSTEIFFQMLSTEEEDDLAGHLLPDEDRDDASGPEDAGSYFFGLTGSATDVEFRRALETSLPWLGERLARPIASELSARRSQGVTLALCGPVTAVPVHAAPWIQDGKAQCLLDGFDVRFAPSAVLAAATLDRARGREGTRASLVALADPTNDLPAARPEVIEIARRFEQPPHVAAGPEAFEYFSRHAPHASHIHLACHARGGLLDSDDAGVLLADGVATAGRLTHVAALQARLVVVSACESALAEIHGMPDEVFSIGTAMIAAGSACAIATLWSVDDLATSLLMTRLYEDLMLGCRPPEALRRAQLWLRDLTAEAEARFLHEHPSLASEFRRRVDEGTRPGRRSPRRLGTTDEVRWYAHSDYWAPFIAIGA